MAWYLGGRLRRVGMAAARPALARESDRWLLWVPALLGLGSASYFGLPVQPSAAIVAAVCCIAVAAAVMAARLWSSRSLAAFALGAVALLGLGVGLAGWRVATVAAPVMQREGVRKVEGRIIELAPRGRGQRVVLDELQIAGLAPSATPLKVRVSIRHGGDGLMPGDRIKLTAFLTAPHGPALPSGFDFARQAWFEGLGAVGWAMGKPERLTSATPDLGTAIAHFRTAVTQRFLIHAGGDSGMVAAALVTGIRAGISDAVWQDMQRSGLAHLLSISGLHMALAAGTLYLTVRWLLALIWPLALRVPVRKLAAGAAIVGATIYLLLAGWTAPTQRSWLMVCAGLAAIILDREPFSIRLLAWAATIVLLLRPEAVLTASFQLSFAAVLALISAYEALRLRALQGDEQPIRVRILRYFLGVTATTLIASLATTPLTAYHFQNIATYGVLANLVAVPLTSFWVMPAGMLALFAMPLGLEALPVQVMAGGVELVLLTAKLAAALPGAAVYVPLWPISALVLAWIGGLWLALWRKPWRLWGLVPMAGALALALLSRPPDIVVEPRMDMLGISAAVGETAPLILSFDDDDLTGDAWERAFAGGAVRLDARRAIPLRQGDLACDFAGCIVTRNGHRVSIARRVEAALEDCALVDLVVARVGPERCPNGGELIGPRALQNSDGLALRLSRSGIEVETVAARRGRWPWSTRTPAAAPSARLGESAP